jgi:hypothetical protein
MITSAFHYTQWHDGEIVIKHKLDSSGFLLFFAAVTLPARIV